MKNIKLFFIVCFTLLFVGCVRDNGNYDYKEIPEFVINGIQVKLNGEDVKLPENRKIILQTNDQLNIVIDGDFTMSTAVTYTWKMFPKGQPNNIDGVFEQPEEIATKKNLDIAFAKGPGNYTLFLEATNIDAKTTFREKFEVEVESINGLLIYHADLNNKGDYSAIRTAQTMPELPVEKLGVTMNIYSAVNGGEKIENPTQIWIQKAREQILNKLFLVSTDNVTVVNYGTHEKESDDYSAIFFIPIEGEAAPQGHMNGAQSEFMVQNGDIHKIDYMNPPKNPVFGVHCGLSGCKYSPYMMSIETVVLGDNYRELSNVVFNKTYRKFEYDYYSGMMDFGYVGGSVNIADTQMDLVYMSKGLGFTISAVMRDDNDVLHYVEFDITDTNMVTSSSSDLSAHGQITGDDLWAISTRANLAFFASGSEIYVYNPKSNRVVPFGADLPSGAEITVLELLNDSTNKIYDNAILLVGYNLGDEGVVMQYQFEPMSGKLDKASQQKFDGFGRILDIELKN